MGCSAKVRRLVLAVLFAKDVTDLLNSGIGQDGVNGGRKGVVAPLGDLAQIPECLVDWASIVVSQRGRPPGGRPRDLPHPLYFVLRLWVLPCPS